MKIENRKEAEDYKICQECRFCVLTGRKNDHTHYCNRNSSIELNLHLVNGYITSTMLNLLECCYEREFVWFFPKFNICGKNAKYFQKKTLAEVVEFKKQLIEANDY